MINKFKLKIEGVDYDVEQKGGMLIVNGQEFPYTLGNNLVTVSGTPHTVDIQGSKGIVDGIAYPFEATGLEEPKPGKKPKASATVAQAEGSITAIMPGLIIKILKKEGDRVAAGEKVIILEAMKMQNELTARKPGVLKQLLVKQGDSVEMRQVLAVIE